jgi:hypothetical protein
VYIDGGETTFAELPAKQINLRLARTVGKTVERCPAGSMVVIDQIDKLRDKPGSLAFLKTAIDDAGVLSYESAHGDIVQHSTRNTIFILISQLDESVMVCNAHSRMVNISRSHRACLVCTG